MLKNQLLMRASGSQLRSTRGLDHITTRHAPAHCHDRPRSPQVHNHGHSSASREHRHAASAGCSMQMGVPKLPGGKPRGAPVAPPHQPPCVTPCCTRTRHLCCFSRRLTPGAVTVHLPPALPHPRNMYSVWQSTLPWPHQACRGTPAPPRLSCCDSKHILLGSVTCSAGYM
jgi:hypothetical protein